MTCPQVGRRCAAEATGLCGAGCATGYVVRVGFSRVEMIGGGARALHAGSCSRVRAAVQSGAYKSTGWAWRPVSSRVRTIITTAVTARRGDRRRAVHTARTPGRGEASARQNSAGATTLVSLLRVMCRARSSACVAYDFLPARCPSRRPPPPVKITSCT